MKDMDALERVQSTTPVPVAASATAVAFEVKAKLVTLGVVGRESRVAHDVTGKEALGRGGVDAIKKLPPVAKSLSAT